MRKGCACRFLYGPETKDDHKSQIEKSLDGKLELKLEVIFYKKNGKWTNKCLVCFGYEMLFDFMVRCFLTVHATEIQL